MVEFETLAVSEVKYGNNNFIEVALKKVSGDDKNTFVSISKGFVDQAGNKRFRGGLGIQLSVAADVAEKIKEMAKAAPAGASGSEEE